VNAEQSYVLGALPLIPTLFGGCRPKHSWVIAVNYQRHRQNEQFQPAQCS